MLTRRGLVWGHGDLDSLTFDNIFLSSHLWVQAHYVTRPGVDLIYCFREMDGRTWKHNPTTAFASSIMKRQSVLFSHIHMRAMRTTILSDYESRGALTIKITGRSNANAGQFKPIPSIQTPDNISDMAPKTEFSLRCTINKDHVKSAVGPLTSTAWFMWSWQFWELRMRFDLLHKACRGDWSSIMVKIQYLCCSFGM